jgi:NAD+ synthase
MKIAISQFNPVLGDFSYNLDSIKSIINKAQKADIIVFPELSICGYNPQDLALRDGFIDLCEKSLFNLVELSQNFASAILVGSISKEKNLRYNSAYLIQHGQILFQHNKLSLPNYGIFDEKRLFQKGDKFQSIKFLEKNLLIGICEDFWDEENRILIENEKADIILSLNASPYSKTKIAKRYNIAKSIAITTSAKFVYVNQVGLQDSIIYDGSSFAVDKNGEIINSLPSFAEDMVIIDTDEISLKKSVKSDLESEIYSALVFALREYCRKNNIKSVTIGFSSGIDSTLTSIIALDALGYENVNLVALPTKFNSKETYKDAAFFEEINNVKLQQIPIQALYDNFLLSLNMKDNQTITSQNLQSRIRGVILMAISNQNNSLLLSTGNKSELAVGYATIYGDMNGGYNLLKDLYKTEIYNLANWRNKNIPTSSKHQILNPIPQNIIIKEPTAELRDNQKDSDSLPEYDILDDILFNYIDLLKSRDYIINLGYDSEIVDQVLNLIRISQFKRYQSTMGPKISDMSFDLEWRYPIINKFY